MKSERFISLVGIALIAACGAPPSAKAPTTTLDAPATTAPPATSSTTIPPDATSGELDIIVPPDQDGEYPADLLVSCGEGAFPLGALDDIRPLDQADPGGIAEAIAPFLANEEGQHWPQEGWQILYLTDQEAHLVATAEHGGLAHMYLTDDGSGWTWSGSSLAGDECRLEFVVPETVNAVDWRLDPEAEAPTPESTAIDLILNERECVGGREIGDRLLGPQIVMTESQVFVAFAAERPEGDAFECPGNPDTQYVVELPMPLGDRELVEGLEIGISLEDYVD